MRGDGVLTNLTVIITLQLYVHQIITLYSIKLYNVICQLYVSKAGKKTNQKNPHLPSREENESPATTSLKWGNWL